MGAPKLPTGGTQAVGTLIDTRCRAGGNTISQELGILLERIDSQPIDGRLVIDYKASDSHQYSLEYPVRVFFDAA